MPRGVHVRIWCPQKRDHNEQRC